MRFRVGDSVFGQAGGCLATSVMVTHHTVVPMPPNLTAEAASTVPTVFLTADACLNAAAIVQPGQRVLIHAATGGPLFCNFMLPRVGLRRGYA